MAWRAWRENNSSRTFTASPEILVEVPLCTTTNLSRLSALFSHYMDAYAHLKGLGWKGTGYSLGRSNSGLKKPILVTHKTDLYGIGLKQQKEKQADQWWLNTFDNILNGIGSNESRLVCVLGYTVLSIGNVVLVCCARLQPALAAKSSVQSGSNSRRLGGARTTTLQGILLLILQERALQFINFRH